MVHISLIIFSFADSILKLIDVIICLYIKAGAYKILGPISCKSFSTVWLLSGILRHSPDCMESINVKSKFEVIDKGKYDRTVSLEVILLF